MHDAHIICIYYYSSKVPRGLFYPLHCQTTWKLLRSRPSTIYILDANVKLHWLLIYLDALGVIHNPSLYSLKWLKASLLKRKYFGCSYKVVWSIMLVKYAMSRLHPLLNNCVNMMSLVIDLEITWFTQPWLKYCYFFVPLEYTQVTVRYQGPLLANY